MTSRGDERETMGTREARNKATPDLPRDKFKAELPSWGREWRRSAALSSSLTWRADPDPNTTQRATQGEGGSSPHSAKPKLWTLCLG